MTVTWGWSRWGSRIHLQTDFNYTTQTTQRQTQETGIRNRRTSKQH